MISILPQRVSSPDVVHENLPSGESRKSTPHPPRHPPTSALPRACPPPREAPECPWVQWVSHAAQPCLGALAAERRLPLQAAEWNPGRSGLWCPEAHAMSNNTENVDLVEWKRAGGDVSADSWQLGKLVTHAMGWRNILSDGPLLRFGQRPRAVWSQREEDGGKVSECWHGLVPRGFWKGPSRDM